MEQSASAEEVSASAYQMSAQVKRMAEQALELAGTAGDLKALVARFEQGEAPSPALFATVIPPSGSAVAAMR
ncbi:hypothetical protein D3C86_2023090 [compost metagenome]